MVIHELTTIGFSVGAGIVISSKKDELLRILEHFNLQVDNPVSILNQDMSRSFFNTTDPKILFKLFLKATQLQQLKDDYAELENTIHSSLKIIESRKECLPDLEREVELQRTNYQFSLSLREKGIKLRNLRHELTWAKVSHIFKIFSHLISLKHL
ncbi:Structural maintenance of chromosomes protein 6 [Chionoecetes opilio]|uniref:Structural maintenance of chromosomes protein 6 n=1 Tax=Chionoecetes opilio TaxID=41210 RepID=A0A8J5CSN7_CHIOP|nr:Structural maintenance of chromosomes protein 6 [Chionoecetes opilio]